MSHTREVISTPCLEINPPQQQPMILPKDVQEPIGTPLRPQEPITSLLPLPSVASPGYPPPAWHTAATANTTVPSMTPTSSWEQKAQRPLLPANINRSEMLCDVSPSKGSMTIMPGLKENAPAISPAPTVVSAPPLMAIPGTKVMPKKQKSMLIPRTPLQETPRSVVVKNDLQLSSVTFPQPDVHLDSVMYTGATPRISGSTNPADLSLFILPRFEQKHHFALIDVDVPYYHLTYNENLAVLANAVWGTDVYADDSDVVAATIHSGFFIPHDHPNHLLPIYPAIQASHQVMDNKWAPPAAPLYGDEDVRDGCCAHDLRITLRILPKLVRYTPSQRLLMQSRGWGMDHDGESYRIEKVSKIPKGSSLGCQ